MRVRAALHLPKEHGAWGMFFIPVLLGLLAAGRFTSDTALFLLAATPLFLARDPFMTAWRCWRRRQPLGSAGRAAAVYLVFALAFGAPLLARRPWLAVIGMAGGAVVVWHAERAMRGKGRSLAAELIAIAASVLSGPAAFYAVTGHFAIGFILWALSIGYFASSVFYVKMRLTQAHAAGSEAAGAARRNCAVYHLQLAGALAAAVALGWLAPLPALAFVPVITRAMVRVVWPTAELNLRQVGWTEVVYSAVFLVLVSLAF